MNVNYVIALCGLFNVGFAIFHMSFWKTFKWDNDLIKLSFANKAVMQILNVQIIYYFIATAIICFWFPNDILNTKLGKSFLASCSIFWLIRFINQFIYLRANHRLIHLLSILFLLGAVLFAIPIFA